jgi:hypothetical protein
MDTFEGQREKLLRLDRAIADLEKSLPAVRARQEALLAALRRQRNAVAAAKVRRVVELAYHRRPSVRPSSKIARRPDGLVE